VNQVIELLGLSKNAYYKSEPDEDRLNKKYEALKEIIKAIITKHPAYGYRRIQKALFDEYGKTVNHKLLKKLLKLWGLSLKRKIRKQKYSVIKRMLDFLEERANLVRRLIQKGVSIVCFQVLLADVTEIKYQQGKAYLSVHMDYAGKMILGWELGKNATSDIVISSFEKAEKTLLKMGIDIGMCIMHQDKGSVNTGYDYVRCVQKRKCTLSYSRTGKPGDNAVNEAFFSRLKDEWGNILNDAKDFDELNRLLKRAIEYYNNERYHSSLGNESPVSYTKRFLENKKANLTAGDLPLVS
jgi:putative transposase